MHDGVFNRLTSSAGFVTPPGTFFHLKMLMLMCILLLHCSGTSEESKQVYRRNLHLLVIADDLLRLQRLLLYGASFAKKMIVHSPISELFASCSRDPFGSGTCMVNGKIYYKTRTHFPFSETKQRKKRFKKTAISRLQQITFLRLLLAILVTKS